MSVEGISVNKVRNILIVTIPIDPDDLAISELQEKVLNAMEKYEVDGLVMDISMVETVDSFFARTIAETGQMISLMGGITIVAGMQPSVAITTTQLGLTLGNALSVLDVDAALELLDRDSKK